MHIRSVPSKMQRINLLRENLLHVSQDLYRTYTRTRRRLNRYSRSLVQQRYLPRTRSILCRIFIQLEGGESWGPEELLSRDLCLINQAKKYSMSAPCTSKWVDTDDTFGNALINTSLISDEAELFRFVPLYTLRLAPIPWELTFAFARPSTVIFKMEKYELQMKMFARNRKIWKIYETSKLACFGKENFYLGYSILT